MDLLTKGEVVASIPTKREADRQSMSDRKAAVLNVSNVLANISLATLAAIGGATGNAPLAGAATLALTAKDPVGALLARVKGKKEALLDIPVPNWWSRDDQAWQDSCTDVEYKLPSIINATAARLEQTSRSRIPTREFVQQVFIDEIARQASPWQTSRGDIDLLAVSVAPPFLEKVSGLLKTAIEPIRQDAEAATLATIVKSLEELTITVQKSGAASPSTPTAGTPTAIGVPQPLPAVAPELSAKEKLQQKWQKGEYDVYICYHKADRGKVITIDAKLKDRGILPWFDALTAERGEPLQAQQNVQLRKIQAAAVFIGKHAVEDWQAIVVEALLNQFVRRKFLRIIPVFLEDAPQDPEMSIFLETFTGVDFREKDPDPFAYLMWGITDERPPIV